MTEPYSPFRVILCSLRQIRTFLQKNEFLVRLDLTATVQYLCAHPVQVSHTTRR